MPNRIFRGASDAIPEKKCEEAKSGFERSVFGVAFDHVLSNALIATAFK
jgi:hypothetical protein